jgi:hypothetical protein
VKIGEEWGNRVEKKLEWERKKNFVARENFMVGRDRESIAHVVKIQICFCWTVYVYSIATQTRVLCKRWGF